MATEVADIATQALYVVLLIAGTHVNGMLRDAMVAQVALLLPAVVAAARGVTIREDRVWSFCFAAAAISFALGNIFYLAWVARQAVAPFPSYADASARHTVARRRRARHSNGRRGGWAVPAPTRRATYHRAAISSAICTAFRAAPLRRLSLLTNSASPRPSGTPGSCRSRPT